MKRPRSALAACLIFPLLLAGCPKRDAQPSQRSAERPSKPQSKPIASPTPPSVARDRRPCNLSKRKSSSRTVAVYLIRKPGLPKTHFVRVERHLGTVRQKVPLEATLRELARGSTPRERRAGCFSYFDSTGPRVLRSVALEGDALTIDFRGDAMFALGATAATSFFLGQLTRTVFQFPEVNSIRLKLDGNCKKFGNAIQSLRCETIRRTEL